MHLFRSAPASSSEFPVPGYFHRVDGRAHPLTLEKVERLAKKLDEKIPTFASEYGGRLCAILEGTEGNFLEAKERFLGQEVDDEVRAHSTEGIVATFREELMKEQKESTRRQSAVCQCICS